MEEGQAAAERGWAEREGATRECVTSSSEDRSTCVVVATFGVVSPCPAERESVEVEGRRGPNTA